jgi:hypothetical protein
VDKSDYTIVRCSTVQISVSGISQIEGDKIALTVPKEEVRCIKLSYDPESRHPFLRFFAGFSLVVAGLIMIIADYLIVEIGIIPVRIASHTFSIPVATIGLWLGVGAGLWLLIGVFRGKYTLLIDTARGIRKIFFATSADIREIQRFIDRANQELGYDIDMSIMDTMHIPHAHPGNGTGS